MKKIFKVFLCLIISFTFLYAQPKSELEKAEAVLPILPILYYLVGGLVADKAVEMGIGFASKKIAKSKTDSIAKDIVLKYEKELTQYPPTKKGAAKALWKYGGKILAEIIAQLSLLALTTQEKGEEEKGDDYLPLEDVKPGSYPIVVDYSRLATSKDMVKYYKQSFNFELDYRYVDKKYKMDVNMKIGDYCTFPLPVFNQAVVPDTWHAGAKKRIHLTVYGSLGVIVYLQYLDANGQWQQHVGTEPNPSTMAGDVVGYYIFYNDEFGSSCSGLKTAFDSGLDVFINNNLNNSVTNYITHDGVTINKNITYNTFNMNNVTSEQADKVDWSKVFGKNEFELEFDLNLDGFPQQKQLFDDLEIDSPIDFDLSDWFNSQTDNNFNFPVVQYPHTGTGGLTQDQIKEISVNVDVDVTVPGGTDGGKDVDKIDGTLLAYVRNAYEYATEIVDTAVEGLKSLASGATGLTALYKTFFGWLPKEMQVLMASGLGIMIGLRIFRK